MVIGNRGLGIGDWNKKRREDENKGKNKYFLLLTPNS